MRDQHGPMGSATRYNNLKTAIRIVENAIPNAANWDATQSLLKILARLHRLQAANIAAQVKRNAE